MIANKADLKKIRQIAEERGISLKWLANQVGISQPAISSLIKENSTVVSTLIRIADALDVPVTVFFECIREGEGIECKGNVGGDFMVNSRKETGLAIEALINQLKVKDQQIQTMMKLLKQS